MDDQIVILPEPFLEFRYGQRVVHPRDGLSIFGPFDADLPSHPASISYGLVGTAEGTKAFAQFATRISAPVLDEDKDLARRLWPIFPGFEAAFGAQWPTRSTSKFELDADALHRAVVDRDANKRAGSVVDAYLHGIERIVARDEDVTVIICVVPDIVYLNCRPKSRVAEGTGFSLKSKQKRIRARGQIDLFYSYDPIHYQFSVDFRRQIKARAMGLGKPIQIVRESTLRLHDTNIPGERGLTPLSDRAWNLSLAVYYKSGGKPWRLASARDGVCYIGMAYRRAENDKGQRTACCAAQMFLDDGDGMVFMGEYGPWYSPQTKEYHISKQAATNLLKQALQSYGELGGKPLREVFLHCRSTIDTEEFEGFQAACPSDISLVGIRVRKEPPGGVRVFREGTRPVLRGTCWLTGDRSCYLWASGFSPRLGTYDGWEVPAPLRINVQHGKADIAQVARDILGLTKLNYNACRLGESQPVTVGFSNAIGEILVSNPTVKDPSRKFKFYI
ncbi:MAG: hypothetical protein NTZ24_14050 [Deltaproteobacteria bacterium]|nr:hypothetical protein [Deltaproteobacteria bacterium]